MKCSRTYPCASCRIRNEKVRPSPPRPFLLLTPSPQCVWEGAIPNGIADEDELEASQTEITRLRKLVGLLVARIDDKEGNRRSSSSSHSHSQSQATSSTYTPYYPPPRNYQQQPYAPYAQVAEGEQTYPVAYPGGPTMRPGARGPEYQRYDEREMGRRVERGEERGEERE